MKCGNMFLPHDTNGVAVVWTQPFWPNLSGPGTKPLDGSIWLKFSLETRLKSESFDNLDDLLGFRVQSYGPKTAK